MVRLKQERLKRGWSLQALGFYAGMQGAEISKIERGIMRPYPRSEREASAHVGSGTRRTARGGWRCRASNKVEEKAGRGACLTLRFCAVTGQIQKLRKKRSWWCFNEISVKQQIHQAKRT